MVVKIRKPFFLMTQRKKEQFGKIFWSQENGDFQALECQVKAKDPLCCLPQYNFFVQIFCQRLPQYNSAGFNSKFHGN